MKVSLSILVPVVLIVASCLTVEDRQALKQKQAEVAAAQKTANATLPGTPEHEAATQVVSKVSKELALLEAEAKIRARERGLTIADSFLGTLRTVIPFIPYGEFAGPLLAIGGSILASMRRKEVTLATT